MDSVWYTHPHESIPALGLGMLGWYAVFVWLLLVRL